MSTSDFPGGGGPEPLSTHGNPLNSKNDLFFIVFTVTCYTQALSFNIRSKNWIANSYIHVLEIILT